MTRFISCYTVMNSCDISIYLGLCICIIIIKYIKNLNFLDPVIIKKPRLTLWSITHFITFYIMGKLCPNQYLRYFMIGILWELFEKIYGNLTNDEVYWTSNGLRGQGYDIIMNMLGYHLSHIW